MHRRQRRIRSPCASGRSFFIRRRALGRSGVNRSNNTRGEHPQGRPSAGFLVGSWPGNTFRRTDKPHSRMSSREIHRYQDIVSASRNWLVKILGHMRASRSACAVPSTCRPMQPVPAPSARPGVKAAHPLEVGGGAGPASANALFRPHLRMNSSQMGMLSNSA